MIKKNIRSFQVGAIKEFTLGSNEGYAGKEKAGKDIAG
jgi:hypothetical protein